MDFDRIDASPLKAGFGCRWQGGTADHDVAQIPGPLILICMNSGELDESLIDHANVFGVLAYEIDDSPSACLPDNVLRGLGAAGAILLANGINLYIHCAAGVSRSSYADIAIGAAVTGEGFAAGLARIRAARPQANPNSGFVAQLSRMYGA